MKKIISILLIIGIAVLNSCKPDLLKNEVSKGGADFTNYVAMGNSLCAGYTDGGLSSFGQDNSYPRMLAQQFLLAGGGAFKTPYITSVGNGNDGSGNPMYQLVITPTGLAPQQVGTASSISDNISNLGPFNHLGIPGIRSIDADIPIYGMLNPFLSRISTTAGSQSLLTLATQMKPTFFSYWLGSNDVLGWATGGGTGTVITTPFAVNLLNYSSTVGALIHPNMVIANITAQIDSLTKNGAKGVIANIPDVASTPYFTTIPYNAIPLTRQGQVDSLNAGYAMFNSLMPASNKIVWHLGANAIVIVDSTAPGYMRQATSEDLICLTASSVLSTGMGSVTPMTDKYVLDKDEKAIVLNYTTQYNNGIKQLADSKGLAFVDANSFLKTFQNGLEYNGVTISPTFVSGGGFGLDGVHPTPRGYALLANEFLKAINLKYGSTLPFVDVNKYRGVLLP